MGYISLLGVLLVAGIASSIVGAIWYSKKVFGGTWMCETGQKDMTQSKKKLWIAMLVGLIGDMVTAFVLLLVSVYTGVPQYIAAPVLWLGFIVPMALGAVFYENRSWKWFGVTAGYRLLSVLAMAAVFYLF